MTPRCARCGRFTTYYSVIRLTQISGPDEYWFCEKHMEKQ